MTPADFEKGDRVVYRNPHDKKPQEGTVTSTNHLYVFVCYGLPGTTSQATKPEDLEKVFSAEELESRMIAAGMDRSLSGAVVEYLPAYAQRWAAGEFLGGDTSQGLLNAMAYALIKRDGARVMATNLSKRRGERIKELEAELAR